MTMAAGTGQVIHLRANAANVFTADPKVAEVRPASPNSLFVFGVAPGTTTVAALDTSGRGDRPVSGDGRSLRLRCRAGARGLVA